MPGPITPKEVQKKRNESIPEAVFKAFNKKIVEHWDGHSANFTLQEVGKLALKSLRDVEGLESLTFQEMCDRGWMDVESIYRKAGWKVEFDKPGYNETYEANFTFTKK